MNVDITAMRDVNERLQPLRRFMADIQLATETAVAYVQHLAEQQAQVEQLEGQLSKLRHDLSVLKGRLKEAQTEYDTEVKRLAKEKTDAWAEHAAFQVEMQKTMAALQTQLETEHAHALRTHQEFLGALATERAKAEADLARVEDARRQALEMMKGLV